MHVNMATPTLVVASATTTGGLAALVVENRRAKTGAKL